MQSKPKVVDLMEALEESLKRARATAPKRSECSSYDGVPEYGGSCWTCRDDPERCPQRSGEIDRT